VEQGGSVTLNWSSTNASSCSASDGWSGSLGTSGSQTVGPLENDQTFALLCSGPGGEATVSVSVSVTPAHTPAPEPTVSLNLSDLEVNVGESVTVSWSSTDATSCSASGGWSGTRGTSGSEVVGPLQSGQTYTLTCSGEGGGAVQMASVTVMGSISMSWQAPTESIDGMPVQGLDSYRIYYGSASRDYVDYVEVSGDVTEHLLSLPVGSYYIAMTAVNLQNEESGYSNEATYDAE